MNYELDQTNSVLNVFFKIEKKIRFGWLEGLPFVLHAFKPISFSLWVLFIFFDCPKKTNQKERALFQRCFLKIFYQNLQKTSRKAITNLYFYLIKAFRDYTDEKDKHHNLKISDFYLFVHPALTF